MEAAIQRAHAPDATIESVLRPTQTLFHPNPNPNPNPNLGPIPTPNHLDTTLTHPPNSTLYFATLIPSSSMESMEPSSSAASASVMPRREGMVGLLLLPAEEGIDGRWSVMQCKLYLEAVARQVENVLSVWNEGNISMAQFLTLMKAIRAAALQCSEAHQRNAISSSGILPALAKLAHNYNPPQSPDPLLTEHSHSTGTSSSSLNFQFAALRGRKADKRSTKNKQLNAKNSLPKPRNPLPFHSIWNPAHTEWIYTCTLAAQYRYASQMLAQHVVYAVGPPSPTGGSRPSTLMQPHTRAEGVLRYFYHVGVVHLACDHFRLALDAFRTCMTIPSKCVSAITIQARKKSLLASCLVLAQEEEEEWSVVAASGTSLAKEKRGAGVALKLAERLLAIPDAASTVVSRYFVNVGEGASSSSTASGGTMGREMLEKEDVSTLKAYDELVIAFAALHSEEVDRLVSHHNNVWEEDGNLGLVKRVQALMKQRKVRKISKIYEAVPLEKLQALLGGSDLDSNTIESLLMQFAFQQESTASSSSPLSRMPIDFSIDQEKKEVHFYLDGECGEDEDEGEIDREERERVQEELSKRITTCMKLAERITNLDIAVAVSGKYQSAVIKDKSTKGVHIGAPRSVVDME